MRSPYGRFTAASTRCSSTALRPSRGGTRFTVSGDFHLKGFAQLLKPFLRGYARRKMERLQLQPVKAEAEARARRAAEPTGPAEDGFRPGDLSGAGPD